MLAREECLGIPSSKYQFNYLRYIESRGGGQSIAVYCAPLRFLRVSGATAHLLNHSYEVEIRMRTHHLDE